jgi:hypothetical protein
MPSKSGYIQYRGSTNYDKGDSGSYTGIVASGTRRDTEIP